MDALQAIRTRRSIRAYTDQAVPETIIDELLGAAMQAPSARNQQPWHFVVLTRRDRLNALAEIMPYGKMLHHAPLGIVVCADLEHETSPGYWVEDCSAATQNLLLAAHALGLGAVWLGMYPSATRVAAVRALLGLPEGVTPLCGIAVGYPAEAVPPVDRYQSERVHREKW
jgi:nitroreductase